MTLRRHIQDIQLHLLHKILFYNQLLDLTKTLTITVCFADSETHRNSFLVIRRDKMMTL